MSQLADVTAQVMKHKMNAAQALNFFLLSNMPHNIPLDIISVDKSMNNRILRLEGVSQMRGTITRIGPMKTRSLIVKLDKFDYSTFRLVEGYHRYHALKELNIEIFSFWILHPDTPDIICRVIMDAENNINSQIVTYTLFDKMNTIVQFTDKLVEYYEEIFKGKTIDDIPNKQMKEFKFYQKTINIEHTIDAFSKDVLLSILQSLPHLGNIRRSNMSNILRIIRIFIRIPSAWKHLEVYNQENTSYSLRNLYEICLQVSHLEDENIIPEVICLVLHKMNTDWFKGIVAVQDGQIKGKTLYDLSDILPLNSEIKYPKPISSQFFSLYEIHDSFLHIFYLKTSCFQHLK